MKKNKPFTITLTKKFVTSEWGKKCKVFEPFCSACMAWLAYEILEGLYYDELNNIELLSKKYNPKKEFEHLKTTPRYKKQMTDDQSQYYKK